MVKIEKRKGKVRMWIIILIVVGVITVVSVGGIIISAPGRREIAELDINNIDFNKLRDGTYIGEYVGTKDHFRDTKVKVTISGGTITDIEILKGALDKEGKPAILKNGLSMNHLFSDVVKSQTLEVDAVSGATLTSKTHLKALENALKQAQVK